MSPAYFAEDSTPTPPKKRNEIQRESEKHRAKRLSQPRAPRTPIGRKTVPKKRNAKVSARKTASYRKGLAAYRKSETYKIVEARAGGCCEARGNSALQEFSHGGRCCGTRADGFTLHHHHVRYQRFGGKELPADILLLCTYHHAAAELKARPWNRNRKFSGFGGKQ